MSVAVNVPQPLRNDEWTTRLIRDFIWKPAVQENDWAVFAVVGREGSGKSLTCASILKAVDPSFNASRAHFHPVPFLKDIANGPDRPGVAVMGDEFGVGFGKRTWQDREQIEANQALQTARDDNRIVGLTVPRLEELDSQLEGRIHLLLETTKKKDGEYVECKFKVVDPSRDGAGKVYRKYPKYHIGDEFKPQRIRMGPPPQDFIKDYERKKAEFKGGLFDRVIDRYEEEFEQEEQVEEKTPKQIATEIAKNGKIEAYKSTNPSNGVDYINQDLLRSEFGLTKSEASALKAYLERADT